MENPNESKEPININPQNQIEEKPQSPSDINNNTQEIKEEQIIIMKIKNWC